MAVTDEFYSSDRLKLPEESAFAGYMRGFMGQRASMNAAAMEAGADPELLADQAIELRRRLGDLAKLKQASSSGDSEAQAGIIEAMLRYEGQVQSARLRGQAQVTAQQIRSRETALRNSIRAKKQLRGELALSAASDGLLTKMGDSVARGETTAPRTVVDKADEVLQAVLSEHEKAIPGSAKHDAAVYRAYQELVAAGQPEAARMLWAKRGFSDPDPSAHMATQWGMETPPETLQIMREIERGGVGRAESASTLAERYAPYIGGATTTRTTSGASTGGTPAQPGSVRVSGLPLSEALTAYMANPSDSSTLDALIADTQRAIAENEAAQAKGRNPAMQGRLPNLLLANPFQVVRTESLQPYRQLAAMEQGQRDETVATLLTTRGLAGRLRPEVAEGRQAAMGGMSPAPVPWANVRGGGESVFGWLYGRLKLAEQRAGQSPGAPRMIQDDGGWTYEQRPDGSVLVVTAPPGSDAMGQVLRGGDAHAAITAKFGGYVHPAIAAVRDDLAKVPGPVRARLGGVELWLARGDVSAAGKEALTLAQSDDSTFGEAYSAALETAAGRGDANGVAEVLDGMAALPSGVSGEWADAYLQSVRRGTLQDDMPKIGAAVRARPMFEMEPVGQGERGPAGVPAAFTYPTPPTPTLDEYQHLRALRAAESRYMDELAPFSFSDEDKRRFARETAAKVVGGTAVVEPPPASPPAPVPVVAPAPVVHPPAPPPVMDFGETMIPPPSMTALPAPPPIEQKRNELRALIQGGQQDAATKQRKQQLTDEINAMRAQAAQALDPSMAGME